MTLGEASEQYSVFGIQEPGATEVIGGRRIARRLISICGPLLANVGRGRAPTDPSPDAAADT